MDKVLIKTMNVKNGYGNKQGFDQVGFSEQPKIKLNQQF